MKFASLMAHEDAELDCKPTGHLGVKQGTLKVKPVSKKKRTQPENISIDVESKPSPTMMMQSSVPLKHYISNAIVTPQLNKLKPQDVDEDYDNIWHTIHLIIQYLSNANQWSFPSQPPTTKLSPHHNYAKQRRNVWALSSNLWSQTKDRNILRKTMSLW